MDSKVVVRHTRHTLSLLMIASLSVCVLGLLSISLSMKVKEWQRSIVLLILVLMTFAADVCWQSAFELILWQPATVAEIGVRCLSVRVTVLSVLGLVRLLLPFTSRY